MAKNRFILYLLFSLFSMPLLFATLLYFCQSKKPIKHTAHGLLHQPAVPIKGLKHNTPRQWHLIYIKTKNNTPVNQKSFQVIQGIHSMLGEKSRRVKSKALFKTQLSYSVEEGTTLIIDPNHNLVLSYPQTALLSYPQGVIFDLKKLLQVSRIG